jgi:hypothetical protein
MPQNSSGIGLEVQHRWFHEVGDLKSVGMFSVAARFVMLQSRKL